VLLVAGPVRDRRVFHGCSFANQVATFFAKSRSIRKTAFSLRSCDRRSLLGQAHRSRTLSCGHWVSMAARLSCTRQSSPGWRRATRSPIAIIRGRGRPQFSWW
jgi:hypothetical protein